MNTPYKTDQEQFWAIEKFAKEYQNRNCKQSLVATNISLFADILKHVTSKPDSILELGSNIGLNLQALRNLLPDAALSAIEINETAANTLSTTMPDVSVSIESLLAWKPTQLYDFVFTKGVLIHINPDALEGLYQRIYDSSNRYILIAEYYNPTPVSINYRGHNDRLFKRDFAGEFLDMFPQIRCINYGFTWHRDNFAPQDDITWFLMEKIQPNNIESNNSPI